MKTSYSGDEHDRPKRSGKNSFEPGVGRNRENKREAGKSNPSSKSQDKDRPYGSSSPSYRSRDQKPWKERGEENKYGSGNRSREEGGKKEAERKTGSRGENPFFGQGRKVGGKNTRNPYDRRPKRPRITRDRTAGKTASAAGKDGTTRLNKYIAHAGICSRREADDLIKAGLVSINDQVVTEMGIKVNPGDVVKYNGEKLRSEKKIYILLNKPKDFVTTSDDPEGRKTVIDLIKNACDERVYPVGRLDRNTTGVLLLTNDGGLATRLTHPKYNVKKVYQVFLESDFKEEDFNKMAEGLTLDDGFIKPDAIDFVNPVVRKEIGMEIHSGKNHIVRRMFEHLGYKVIRLDRVLFAGLTKKNLPRGRYRLLTDQEINMLKMNAFE